MASENFKKHSSAEEVEGEAAGAGASRTSLTAQIHVSWYDTPLMILDISLNSPHQQMPPPPDAPTPLIDFILLSGVLHGKSDLV